MTSKSSIGLAVALTIIMTLFVVNMFVPLIPSPTPVAPTPTVSQTLTMKVPVAHWANESWAATDATGATLKLYDTVWNLQETITVSSGLFTSAYFYDSGDILRYKFECTGYQTKTGSMTIPYYASSDQPLSGYHTMPSVIVAYNPTAKCSFAVESAYNSSATVTYNTTLSGAGVIQISVEFYNTLDESRLYNYQDSNYLYAPLVVVESVVYNASNPTLVSIQGLEQVRVETASTSGLYIYQPTENSLNRNKNQATSALIENNRITVSFTIDTTQVNSAGENSTIKFTLYDSVDVAYFRSYKAPNAGFQTLQASGSFGLLITA